MSALQTTHLSHVIKAKQDTLTPVNVFCNFFLDNYMLWLNFSQKLAEI